MSEVRRVVVVVLMALIVLPNGASAQAQADTWRAFAMKLDVGIELTIRLRDGQRFRATFVGAPEEALLVQPKTRVPVPVQPVPYNAILSIERRSEGGIGAGKAAAIGVASGVAGFLAVLLIIASSLD